MRSNRVQRVERGGALRERCVFGAAFIISLLLIGRAIHELVHWPRMLVDQGAPAWLAQSVMVIAFIAIFSACRWSVLFLCSFLAHRRPYHPFASLSEQPFVSILVPCFNEEQTIAPALESLLELDYPAYELIVVNDGSTDATLARAAAFQGEHGGCAVRVYDKPNGGKWAALNFGFHRANGTLMLCVDADSRLERDSLSRMVARMADPAVSAVAGQVRVRNRVNLITRVQGLEYLMGNGAVRQAQGLFRCVLVIPGPIGLFRASVLQEVERRFGGDAAPASDRVPGPFEGDTFAEDFDVSIAILCVGGHIVYEPEAISHTTAPDTLFALMNQRYRWIRGSLQVVRKLMRRATADPGVLSPRLVAWSTWVLIPDCLIIPMASIAGYAVLLILLVSETELRPLFAWYGAFLVLQASAGAFFVGVHRDRASTLAALPALGIYSSFVLTCAWIVSMVDEVRNARMRW
ncbi:MAG TPA: glycosyltransferase [Burkholderiales bacterium]|nr:glycosyltransferase [Burkholderiales bacterium]